MKGGENDAKTPCQCIAPELIVLRVIRGRSWTRDTLSGAPTSGRRGSSNGNEPVSEIEFASFASPGVSKRDDEESIIEVLSSGDRTRSTLQSMTEKSGSQAAADSQSSRSKVEKE
ncbi:hypothetical protein C8F01DRAFT_1095599 [Mycena amicta]|nr:hypothetical protein C8F01DRAFT_1095599 [Mycena amicta]